MLCRGWTHDRHPFQPNPVHSNRQGGRQRRTVLSTWEETVRDGPRDEPPAASEVSTRKRRGDLSKERGR